MPTKKEPKYPGGKYLRELRKAKNITQRQLGQALGYKKDNEVRALELGARSPCVEDLTRIRKVLELKFDQWRTLLEYYGLGLESIPSFIEDMELAEKTYYRYRNIPVPLMDSPALNSHLESRYRRSVFQLNGKAFPATVLWQNEDKIIAPDTILGRFDKTLPAMLRSSPILGPEEYVPARAFIKAKYEDGPIKYEGINYCMTHIDDSADPPQIQGAYGLYYDNILTQYAIEWELRKALLQGGRSAIASLTTLGTLPLREAIEAQGDPILNGDSRCTAITISTLVVFKRRDGKFYCLMRRRSMNVGVSPGMLHVVPSGMFEAKDISYNWSVEMNVWRELLEEVYNAEEQQGTGTAEPQDYIKHEKPIALLRRMIRRGSAEFSVTGICCDLLNLRPEITTVLFVKDPRFAEAKRMDLNWEYLPLGVAGKFMEPWEDIDEMMQREGSSGGIVASGAVCLGLGREWIRNRHKF